MLKRLTICLALSGAPLTAAAQSVEEQIITQLRAQGFAVVERDATWLGRVRLVAVSDDLERELVFNPQTGEILRDYWEGREGVRIFNPFANSSAGSPSGSSGSGSSSGGGASGGGAEEDDDEDDQDDDEDDDDEDDDEDDDDDDDDDEDDDDDDDDNDDDDDGK